MPITWVLKSKAYATNNNFNNFNAVFTFFIFFFVDLLSSLLGVSVFGCYNGK